MSGKQVAGKQPVQGTRVSPEDYGLRGLYRIPAIWIPAIPQGCAPVHRSTERIHHTAWEAAPKQVAGPSVAYISLREIAYSTPGAKGAQGAVCDFPKGNALAGNLLRGGLSGVAMCASNVLM